MIEDEKFITKIPFLGHRQTRYKFRYLSLDANEQKTRV
jgi:hypothetical protein